MESRIKELSRYRFDSCREALDGFDSSKHSGVIAHFNQQYVKEGVFPKEMSKWIKLASEKRESADYMDFYAASKADAEEQIRQAAGFVKEIERYLKEQQVL